MHRTLRTTFRGTILRTTLALLTACGARALAAQDPAPVQVPAAPPKTHWRGSVDANGTILYGAANQRIFTSGANASFIDPGFELRFDLQGGYGDSRNQNTGVRSVIARNIRLSSAFDWRPHHRTSPFAFASAETNYQQRYQSRVAGGVGAKQTFWRPDTVRDGFNEDLSLSLAVLGEHTQLRDDAPAASQSAAGSRVRYSLRARFRKRINGTIRFSHVTLYQPTANDLNRYTLDAFTELAIPVRTRLQFTVTHRERLDSEAEKRGAVSIRDGQVLFGLRATF
ncbi:MAG: DUF481 domain-containing protein [Gemmatimonas sp.]